MIVVKKEVNKMIKAVLLDHLKFKEERKVSKLSQEKIAEQLGISDRYVRNLEAEDRCISAQLLYRIHILFDKPMEYFLIVTEEG